MRRHGHTEEIRRFPIHLMRNHQTRHTPTAISTTMMASVLSSLDSLMVWPLCNQAARFTFGQLRQEHLKSGSSGIATWPHCSQISQPGRCSISLP